MFVRAPWQAPASVVALTTTRHGGVSEGPYSSLNLALHVGDDPHHVEENRARMVVHATCPRAPVWLSQVHGTRIVTVDSGFVPHSVPEADGVITRIPHQPLAILTADCLPVAICSRSGTAVGLFHAGWRGLLSGILELGVEAMGTKANELMAWIGPGIGPLHYQVGAEVHDAFVSVNSAHGADFKPDGMDHWLFDLAGAAQRRLIKAGVSSIVISGNDTFAEESLYFSHRRQTISAPGTACGRQTMLIWIQPEENL